MPPIDFTMTVFGGDACKEFVEGGVSFFLGFENKGAVHDLEGNFAIRCDVDGVGDRTGDSEGETTRGVGREGYAIGHGVKYE